MESDSLTAYFGAANLGFKVFSSFFKVFGGITPEVEAEHENLLHFHREFLCLRRQEQRRRSHDLLMATRPEITVGAGGGWEVFDVKIENQF